MKMPKTFTCKRCGQCCRSPRLYKADIERIKKLGYKQEDFLYTDNFNNNYLKDNEGWCLFHQQGKTSRCLIYKKRPKICRQYPSELRKGSCKPVELAFDKYLEKRLK